MRLSTLVLSLSAALLGCEAAPVSTAAPADAGGCATLCGSVCCAPGQTCQGGVCSGACVASCANRQCGSDGCGGNCGTCGAGLVCNASGQCETCTPSCGGKGCGDDGCGGSCGACTGNTVCQAGQCVACTPTTCAAQAKNCGTISDGCGRTLTCGTCTGPQTCGGGGTQNVCGDPGCVKKTCAGEGAKCGTIPDGCGGTVTCPTCPQGETCGVGGANQCGVGTCTPETDRAFCTRLGADCGAVTSFDNCDASRTVNCGTCASPQSCGVNIPNVCADDCRLKPCAGFTWCDTASGACKAGCAQTGQCGANEVCNTTSHACDCAAGAHRCGTGCVLDTSVSACGASCAPCAVPANGQATCDGTACGFTCNAGFHACGTSCLSNTSVQSCGTSCTPCATDPNGAASCKTTGCFITCNTGFRYCSGACAACPAATGATYGCSGASCVITGCASGYQLCGGTCALCPSGASVATTTCSGTTCVVATCSTGYQLCGGSCATCPADANATAFGCTGSSTCEITNCKPGYFKCPTGCCPWTIDTLSTSSGIRGTALALDANGKPRIAWVDTRVNVTSRGVDASTGIVDATTNPAAPVAIAVDSTGKPRVAYLDATNERLKYAAFNGTTWTIETDTYLRANTTVAMVLDSKDSPLIMTRMHGVNTSGDYYLPEYVTRYPTGGFYESHVDSYESAGWVALARGANDTPLIAFYDLDHGDLRYMENAPGYGVAPAVETAGDVGNWVSVAADAQGKPHLAYLSTGGASGTSGLRYAYKTGTAWTLQTVDPYTGILRTAIAIDSTGKPWIAYSTNLYGLKLARFDGATWRTSTLAGSGYYPSLRLDAQDKPHVVYFDGAALKYAH